MKTYKNRLLTFTFSRIDRYSTFEKQAFRDVSIHTMIFDYGASCLQEEILANNEILVAFERSFTVTLSFHGRRLEWMKGQRTKDKDLRYSPIKMGQNQG